MSLHIELEKELKQKFKEHALKRRVSMKEIIVKLIEEVVSDGRSNG